MNHPANRLASFRASTVFPAFYLCSGRKHSLVRIGLFDYMPLIYPATNNSFLLYYECTLYVNVMQYYVYLCGW